MGVGAPYFGPVSANFAQRFVQQPICRLRLDLPALIPTPAGTRDVVGASYAGVG